MAWQLDTTSPELGFRAREIHSHNAHSRAVTQMVWRDQAGIFSGDSGGKVLYAPLLAEGLRASGGWLFTLTKQLATSYEVLMPGTEDAVVQMDRGDAHTLLVSTTRACFLLHTDKQSFRKIGEKSRDGPYVMPRQEDALKKISKMGRPNLHVPFSDSCDGRAGTEPALRSTLRRVRHCLASRQCSPHGQAAVCGSLTRALAPLSPLSS